MRHIGLNYTKPMNPPPQGHGVILVDAMQYGFGSMLNSDEECITFVNKMVESLLEKQEAA
jgi:hypothetical protein